MPLVETLCDAGVRVWIDAHELRVGDSLSEKVDAGLAASQFGVVILSPNFFAKHWPKKELAGLRSHEEDGQKVILPIWHNVDKTMVCEFSPILADVLAEKTSDGLDVVAQNLLNVLLRAGILARWCVACFVVDIKSDLIGTQGIDEYGPMLEKISRGLFQNTKAYLRENRIFLKVWQEQGLENNWIQLFNELKATPFVADVNLGRVASNVTDPWRITIPAI